MLVLYFICSQFYMIYIYILIVHVLFGRNSLPVVQSLLLAILAQGTRVTLGAAVTVEVQRAVSEAHR